MHSIELIKMHLIILYLFYLICVSEGSFCNVRNKCVPCSKSGCSCPLIQEIMARNLTPEDVNVLRNSICKKDFICCPIDLPVPPVCGIYYSTNINKIYGGEKTALEEFPWVVLIKGIIDGYPHQLCGGSLINKRYILTAAHCIKYKIPNTNQIQIVEIESVRFGEWNKTSTLDCINGICSDLTVDIKVEKVILHKNYTPGVLSNDIALLRLAKDVVYTKYIQPICLPIEDELINDIYNKRTSFVVVGWGYTEHSNYTSPIKLKASLPSYNNLNCRNMYQRGFNTNLINSQICAGGEDKTDACKGDSGGPLMYVNNNNVYNPKYYLAGIVSYGPFPCGRNGTPGIYTRVGSYIDWILEKIVP